MWVTNTFTDFNAKVAALQWVELFCKITQKEKSTIAIDATVREMSYLDTTKLQNVTVEITGKSSDDKKKGN